MELERKELQYEIQEESIRSFVAGLSFLGNIGKEISIECIGTKELVISVLDDSQSSFGCVRYQDSFFAKPIQSQVSDFIVRSKVYAKAVLNIFRNLKHVRTVTLTLILNQKEDPTETQNTYDSHEDVETWDCEEIQWRLHCDYAITKTHFMKVHTSSIMRPIFDIEMYPNRLVTRQFHWSSLLAHIHHTTQICVICSRDYIKLESYFASLNTDNNTTHLQTETAVESDAFMEYKYESIDGHERETKLIFHIKEIRAFLSLCKATDLVEITLLFREGGDPILFTSESTSTAKFSVELILSTLTIFLPAFSQTQSETGEVEYGEQKENDESEQPRYLTRNLDDS